MKEKVAALIDDLQKLKDEDATINELLHYTKLLYAELMCAKGEEEQEKSSRKVSVILPGYPSGYNRREQEERIRENISSKEKKEDPAEAVSALSQKEETVVVEKKHPEPAISISASEQHAEMERETPSLKEKEKKRLPLHEEKPVQSPLWNSTPETEVIKEPKPRVQKELNDLIAEQRPSLNDRLKKDREEIAGRLGNSTVRDLHQAIGLNEKFGFINELFRGDQSLYNRSIKTINTCHDLQEALYWINRELKIKLGWQDNNKDVQRFYAIIKKRFA